MSKTLNLKLKNFIATLSESELNELGIIARVPEEAISIARDATAKYRNLDIRISEVLQRLGIPAHIKGYPYLRNAIATVVKEPSAIDSVTHKLYPMIAEDFNTTPSRTERAIRHAIEVAWNRGDPDYCAKLFGYTISENRGKPTNSEFIAMIADHIRLGRV